MGEIVLKTSSLTKYFKRECAVNNVNMTIHEGDIYGLIGKNGAGKTTLMRLITGMAVANSGEIELFGMKDVINARKYIGNSIENPAIFSNMSAYDNLKFYNKMYGIKSDKNIYSLLKKVRLDANDKKIVDKYSLGMKQRLAIAIALINNPKFLVLDEPINGLDPEGIGEIRRLLLDLNNDGITILISSHILLELDKLATRYGIMDNGKLVKELTKNEYKQVNMDGISIKVDNIDRAINILRDRFNIRNVRIDGEHINIYGCMDISDKINKELTLGDVLVKEIKPLERDLEEVFMDYVGERTTRKNY